MLQIFLGSISGISYLLIGCSKKKNDVKPEKNVVQSEKKEKPVKKEEISVKEKEGPLKLYRNEKPEHPCSKKNKNVKRIESTNVNITEVSAVKREDKKPCKPSLELYRNIRPNPVSKDGYQTLVDMLKKQLVASESLFIKQGALFYTFDFLNDTIDCGSEEYVRIWHSFDASDANKTLNRYENIKCNDATRVFLENRKNDYINASWIICDRKEYRGKNILTQGPLKHTIPDFWAMIYQEKVEYIVMFCPFIEKGVEQCAQYYPINEGGVAKYDNFEVKHVRKEKDPVEGVTWTVLHLIDKNSNETRPRRVNHIYVSWWPENTAPDDPKLTLELYKWLMKKNQSHIPMVFHCNNGVGRSATFAAIYFFLRFDIQPWKRRYLPLATILMYNIQHRRDEAIETPLNFLFLHVCLIEYFIQEGDMERTKEVDVFMSDYKKYAKEVRECVRANKPISTDVFHPSLKEKDKKKKEKDTTKRCGSCEMLKELSWE